MCTPRRGGKHAVCLHLAGEIDLSAAPRLEGALREALCDERLVVVDLRGLDFIDSSGIHAFLAAGAVARARGRRLVLIRGAAAVDRVFTLTGAADALEICDGFA